MSDKVVPLGRDPDPEEPPAASRPPRAQGLAIGGMTIFAVAGALAALSLFTVGLSDGSQRIVVGIVFFSAVGFLTCASIAVLVAARQTYAGRSTRRPPE